MDDSMFNKKKILPPNINQHPIEPQIHHPARVKRKRSIEIEIYDTEPCSDKQQIPISSEPERIRASEIYLTPK